MSSLDSILAWAIVGGAIAGILLRPRELLEAVWACPGALLLVVCRLVPAREAAGAVAKGTDVYLFLTGMMLLAELARRYGVFEWLAALAVRAARGSATRLFALIYAAGVLVTVFLSIDATAVVLTPAVYAAIRKARADPPPYVFVCAFIANAASFVLPISIRRTLWFTARTCLRCCLGCEHFCFRRSAQLPRRTPRCAGPRANRYAAESGTVADQAPP